MNENIVSILIAQTNQHKIRWESTISPQDFMAVYDDNVYIISQKETDVILYKWINEEIQEIIIDSRKEQDNLLLTSLFETIIKSDNRLNLIYQNFKKMKENNNQSVSLYKVMRRLGYESDNGNIIVRLKDSSSFKYMTKLKPEYVEPPMVQIPTSEGVIPLSDAEVVLISAPGATGKTAMTEWLSVKLGIPVLDLGKHDAVGANTISGLILKFIETDDLFKYHSGLLNGNCAMIIDGLDEASIKANQDGMEAFYKDIASFAKGAHGLPFIMLGRTSVMYDAVLTLEDLGVKVTHLQIEPFTIDKARDFIDKHIPETCRLNHSAYYKQVRDYIIDQIGGFFKNESDMNHKLFERFIGYAPVLRSIVTLLQEEVNYYSLLNSLQNNKKQRIELLLDIVNYIITREKKKIEDEVLQPLFDKNRPSDFVEKVKNKAGIIEEQCLRILYFCLNKSKEFDVSDDASFNDKYNKKMKEWIAGHPFVDKDKHIIHNVVFESYIIANLINKQEYTEDVLCYLKSTNSNSYLLLDIYAALEKDKDIVIDHRFFSYLYSSFKSLDHPQDIGLTEIYADDIDDNVENITCEFSFARGGIDAEYDFKFRIGRHESFVLPSSLSEFTIEAPLNIKTNAHKTEIYTPCVFICHSFSACSYDFVVTDKHKKSVIVECEDFNSVCEDGNIPLLTYRAENKRGIKIVTNSPVLYPFCDYKQEESSVIGDDTHIDSLYNKMRRMILLFRSHNKGVLARCRSKIDNRIGKNEIGKSIIDAFIKSGIFSVDNVMYFINSDKLAEILGLKYDDIRSCVKNENTIRFLQSIVSKI